MEPIAQNVFTYIRDSGAEFMIVDGRCTGSLTQEPPQGFDVLVVDAFSGDAIPLHLLTTQALALYRKHLAPGGDSRLSYFKSACGSGAADCAACEGGGNAGCAPLRPVTNDQRGEFTATWMLVSDNGEFFDQPEVASRARQPTRSPG